MKASWGSSTGDPPSFCSGNFTNDELFLSLSLSSDFEVYENKDFLNSGCGGADGGLEPTLVEFQQVRVFLPAGNVAVCVSTSAAGPQKGARGVEGLED